MTFRIIYPCLFAGLLIAVACTPAAIPADASKVQLKTYTFSQVDGLMAKEQRPVAVFLHASWCRYCKNMEQTTLKNPAVIDLLNNNYYFISFDGELQEEIFFRNRRFIFLPSGPNAGLHELAIALGTIEGELAYPTFVLLNPEYDIVFQHGAFMTGRALRKVLAEGVNMN